MPISLAQKEKELWNATMDELIAEAQFPKKWPAYMTTQEIVRRMQQEESYEARLKDLPDDTVKNILIQQVLQNKIGEPPPAGPVGPAGGPEAMAGGPPPGGAPPGMPPGGPPGGPPGMPGGAPPGMPPGAAPQMAAHGGIIGFANGGSRYPEWVYDKYRRKEYRPSYERETAEMYGLTPEQYDMVRGEGRLEEYEPGGLREIKEPWSQRGLQSWIIPQTPGEWALTLGIGALSGGVGFGGKIAQGLWRARKGPMKAFSNWLARRSRPGAPIRTQVVKPASPRPPMSANASQRELRAARAQARRSHPKGSPALDDALNKAQANHNARVKARQAWDEAEKARRAAGGGPRRARAETAEVPLTIGEELGERIGARQLAGGRGSGALDLLAGRTAAGATRTAADIGETAIRRGLYGTGAAAAAGIMLGPDTTYRDKADLPPEEWEKAQGEMGDMALIEGSIMSDIDMLAPGLGAAGTAMARGALGRGGPGAGISSIERGLGAQDDLISGILGVGGGGAGAGRVGIGPGGPGDIASERMRRQENLEKFGRAPTRAEIDRDEFFGELEDLAISRIPSEQERNARVLSSILDPLMAGFEARPGGQTFMEKWREAEGVQGPWNERDRQRILRETQENAALQIRERRHDDRVGYQRDPTEEAAANIDGILSQLQQQLSSRAVAQEQADAMVMQYMLQLRAQNPWLQPENMERVVQFLQRLAYDTSGGNAAISQEGLEGAMAILGQAAASGIGGSPTGLGGPVAFDPLASMNVR